MSLNRGEINALGVLGLRKLSFMPDHFAKITIDKSIDIKMLEHWINYNLNSRYSITTDLTMESNKIVEILEIGLEDPKEITILTLGCPYLHQQ
jgi:hypothetical protein